MLALLTQREAAELLRLSERHLERLRVAGTGPKFMRLGKHKSIRYRPIDVEAWVTSRLVGSTSEEFDEGTGLAHASPPKRAAQAHQTMGVWSDFSSL